MPEYKKKKKHIINRAKPNGKFSGKSFAKEDIPMQRSHKKTDTVPTETKPMRVVKGKKLERIHRLKIFALSAVLIVAAVGIISYCLPAGLWENITNLTAVIGSGSYPVELYGSETLDCEKHGTFFYVLTDTNISAYSNAGKEIFRDPHGFAAPMLRTSETRALVLDQHGNNYCVYNLSKKVCAGSEERPIITGALSRSGNFAVATDSDDYTSCVKVFDKRGNKIYEWNSAKDMINSVAISPSGKKIAVSTLNASGGQLISHIYVLEYGSANAVYSMDISGKAVLSLENIGNGFSVITNSGSTYIDWNKYTREETVSDINTDMFRRGGNGALLVFNRASDKSDNRIAVLSKKGKKQSEFTFNGIISDIVYFYGHIYCVNDTKVYMLDKQGNQLSTGECGYGAKRIIPIDQHNVAVVTDNGITRIKIGKEE